MTESMQPAVEPVVEVAPSFFEEHKNQILTGGVLLAVLLVGYAIWQINTYNTQEAAVTAFARAQTADEFEQVASKFRSQPVAVNALIQLSALLREEGKLEESDAKLNLVLNNYPNHPLVGIAMMGLAANREVAGDLDAAIDLYRQIPAKYSGSFAAPLARLSEARLLALRNDAEAAKIVYEDVATSFPNTPAAMVARSELSQLE